MQVKCLFLPGQVSSSPNCEQWRRTDNNDRTEECPTNAHIKEQCQEKVLDRAREKTSFQRWRKLQDLLGLKSDAEFAALLLDR